MRKLSIAIMAVAMGITITSCKQKNEAPQASQVEPTPTETATEDSKVTDSPSTESLATPSLADVVAKAKANGAKWSVDEWKTAYKELFVCIKPQMIKISELVQKLEKDPANAASVMKELGERQEEFKSVETLIEEFQRIAETTANGKSVNEDKAFQKQVVKDLELPEGIFD